eukprot:TRINITY_DN10549_c0_g2_i4.p1 TRINITY_DN10549_c0_g2~~TRINITY_DN10549_c0_g2_i4.p1  ORF type:complete len:110 (+),score=13.82 TRINITY_DN10549_c0_g2_i4:37-330(+)
MSMKQAIKDVLIEKVVRSVTGAEWKVLIVDKMALRMISTSARMSEIMDENVTVVEDVLKRRKPYPTFHGIYLIAPTEEVVNSSHNDIDATALILWNG